MGIKNKKPVPDPRGSQEVQQIRADLQERACIAANCYLWPVGVPRGGQLVQGPCHCLEDSFKARLVVTLLKRWIEDLSNNAKQ